MKKLMLEVLCSFVIGILNSNPLTLNYINNTIHELSVNGEVIYHLSVIENYKKLVISN